MWLTGTLSECMLLFTLPLFHWRVKCIPLTANFSRHTLALSRAHALLPLLLPTTQDGRGKPGKAEGAGGAARARAAKASFYEPKGLVGTVALLAGAAVGTDLALWKRRRVLRLDVPAPRLFRARALQVFPGGSYCLALGMIFIRAAD